MSFLETAGLVSVDAMMKDWYAVRVVVDQEGKEYGV